MGGHCIGVDPYYLTTRRRRSGYYPEIMLASRRINESMGRHVAAAVIKLLVKRRRIVPDARILILGLTFKENCPDLRNTRVAELVRQFHDFGATVDVHDDWADPAQTLDEYGLPLLQGLPRDGNYDAIVLAVAMTNTVRWGSCGPADGARGRSAVRHQGRVPEGRGRRPAVASRFRCGRARYARRDPCRKDSMLRYAPYAASLLLTLLSVAMLPL